MMFSVKRTLTLLLIVTLLGACGDNAVFQTSACGSAMDCPGADTECETRTCTDGVCGFDLTAAGTAVTSQTTGDCQQVVCDGAGNQTTAPDDSDAPATGNECDAKSCSGGVVVEKIAASGTTCGAGLTCDGQGACTGCTIASECPGVDDDCATRSCSSGVCGFAFQPSGTVRDAAHQTAGDCHQEVCDGAGGSGSATVDDADVPDDSNACTTNVCTDGAPSNPPVAERTACGTDGLCDATGACVECIAASDCPATPNECSLPACVAGVCGVAFEPAGAPTRAQALGDCLQQQCDGSGNIVPATDTADVPDDHNDCTIDTCTGSAGGHSNVAIHTACGPSGGDLECDGSGACVGCVDESECPGHDDDCEQRHCIAGTCSVTDTDAGTLVSHQVDGDCNQLVCDGHGNTVPQEDDGDLPFDNETCTTDVCTHGVASNPPVAAETACSEGTGSRCDGGGACVECLAATECPGTDTPCFTRACSAAHACSPVLAPAGVAATGQTTGDCQDVVCDGAGSASSSADNGDLPVDTNACTLNVCTAGVPSNPNASDGTVCDASGDVCDVIHGVGTCLPPLGGAGGQTWKALGWTGGVPCVDGLRFSVNGTNLYACSTTAGVFATVKTSGVLGSLATVNTGLDSTIGFNIGVHSTVDTQLLYSPVPVAGQHNWAQSPNAGVSWNQLFINDAAGNPRTIVSSRFQQMVGGLWLTYDTAAQQGLVLTGNGTPTATHTIGTTPATGTPRAIVPGKNGGNVDLLVAVFGRTVDGSQCTAAACTGGIFRSTNKGVAWTESDTGIAASDLPLVYSVIQDPGVATSGTLYAALQGGGQVYKTTDDGATWVQSNSGLPAGALVNVITVVDSPAVTLYAATSNGLYISTDGAATWTLAGFAGRNVIAVTMDPTNAATVFVGVDDDVGVYVPGT